MIVNGIVNYFKDLSVGGSLVNSFTGWRQKTRLFYADTENINTSRYLELDATVDINVNLDIELLKTPAENREVYTSGALKKPKVISIQAHINASKLDKLYELYNKMIPVWIMTSKSLPGVITQIGYWSPSTSLFAVNGISIVEGGYDNTVAVTLSLEEIRLFSYVREYQYDLESNKIIKKDKNKVSGNGGGKISPVGYGSWFDPKYPLTDLKKDYLNQNLGVR